MTAADLTPDEAAVLRAVHLHQVISSSLTRRGGERQPCRRCFVKVGSP
jgi:hypothetical protein